MTEDIAEILDDFKKEIMPKVRATIKEHIQTYPDDDLKRSARHEYLKGQMRACILETFYLMESYDRHVNTGDVDNRLFLGERILKNISAIQKFQSEMISLRKPEKHRKGVSDDMIERAKAYPFTELYEFRRNQARCPFHGDKDPSMHLFPDNHVYCFSCAKGWDAIGFVMERDGLSFPDAVRQLQ